MSGYRSLHREKIGTFPIWHVACGGSTLRNARRSATAGRVCGGAVGGNNDDDTWEVVAACGDGIVRIFDIREKRLGGTDVLDASAASCSLTRLLIGKGQEVSGMTTTSKSTRQQQKQDNQTLSDDEGNSSATPSPSTFAVGTSQVRIIRNYVGEDDSAGDILFVSINMVGKVRVWVLPEDSGNKDKNSDGRGDGDGDVKPMTMYPVQEFVVPNATGTCIWALATITVGDVQVAVPCLDGSVVLVATGILTPKTPPKQEPSPAGTVLETWSRGTGSIALSGVWHPSKQLLAIGRQDGLVEILGDRPHRLIHHEAPVRAITYTPDGQLLITASDDGMVSVWDAGRPVPALVRHVVNAHNGWILSLAPLDDSRRFVSSGLDQKVHVWEVGQLDQPAHTFASDDLSWTIDSQPTYDNSRPQLPQKGGKKTSSRLVSGNEQGLLHIYSLS